MQCVNIFLGNTLVTNGPFTALEKIAGSFYVLTMKSDKIHLEPRPVFCKGDKLLKQPAGVAFQWVQTSGVPEQMGDMGGGYPSAGGFLIFFFLALAF